MHGAASPISPSSIRAAFPQSCARRSAIGFTAATTASSCAPGTSLRAPSHPEFKVRHALDAARLTDLFAWSAQDFDARMRGSAIYRIGYERWSRNIAVALGNAPTSTQVVAALRA